MGKYTSKTEKGIASRIGNADWGCSKHRPGLQFNPHTGLPHSPEFFAQRRTVKARKRVKQA